MELYEFLTWALEPDLPHRCGQVLMNRLYSVRPDLYYGIQEDLRINPFYNDSDMWDALVFIHDNWGIPVQSPKKKV